MSEPIKELYKICQEERTKLAALLAETSLERNTLKADNEALRAKCDALGRVRDAAKIWAYRFSGDCKELDEALAACEDGGRKDDAQEEAK